MRKRRRGGKKIFKLILCWLPFVVYINVISPSSIISFAGFYLFLALSLFFSLKIFFSLGRTIHWIGIMLIYLLLRQFHIDNIINSMLLLGILVTLEIYFRKQ
ncbi:hypothetical protein A3D03_06485 [Candidatus Gottesmanbacteria bacterium RIFCSPHIGHO2_02_FULL_40_13]|uniref:Uncharacterized protein n=1 Tax=Candidatus Gottesmanbacteria bacterium RIFCSPHIGHO2_02_FULL_40_13 TaxID=1798384 RepID=A0A1F6A6V8_9BACT|nr:MAG: hypothetical protein A3D03_06485 [Candidatus Gottesmanbacteria bacterium RIFCSPHIGHO2_02_FULL_40_13]